MRYWLSFCVLFILGSAVLAQEATVPDVRGLSAPVAAARLNEAGFALGTVSEDAWSLDAATPPDSIGLQAPQAGGSATQGSAVDVTILRSPNAAAIYDDNDITLLNLSQSLMPLGDVRFTSNGNAAQFGAVQWRGALGPLECGQLWAIARNQPKQVENCDNTYWLSSRQTEVHFWTQLNSVTDFRVVQGAAVRETCPAAPAGGEILRCDFFLATAGTSAETDYIYFVYTTDAWVVYNNSDDQWMPLNETPLYNNNPQLQVPGLSVPYTDETLFPERLPVAQLQRLAPGQCIGFTLEGSDAALPQDCTRIAERELAANVAFWVAAFDIDSSSDGQRRTCPAPQADQRTICVLPR